MKAMSSFDVLTLACAIGGGVIAGFFFAFSFSVMQALGKLPPAQGIAAMQSINVVVINPVFLTLFFGTAALCIAAAVGAFVRWHAPGAAWVLAGAVFYVVGTIVVTMVFNVPRNNALAAVEPSSAAGADLWAAYLTVWTRWNHVRMFASLAATVAFTIAFRIRL